MKFVTTDYGNNTGILKFPDHYVAVAVTVTDSGVSAVAGKKIVKAGTVVGGSTKAVLANLDEPVIVKNTDHVGETPGTGLSAEGVLLNDVDVTNGPASGAMVIHGYLDLGKVTSNVAAPCADAISVLKQIMFIK